MRTMIRSTELGARTKVFFRVMSHPVRWALTVTEGTAKDSSATPCFSWSSTSPPCLASTPEVVGWLGEDPGLAAVALGWPPHLSAGAPDPASGPGIASSLPRLPPHCSPKYPDRGCRQLPFSSVTGTNEGSGRRQRVRHGLNSVLAADTRQEEVPGCLDLIRNCKGLSEAVASSSQGGQLQAETPGVKTHVQGTFGGTRSCLPRLTGALPAWGGGLVLRRHTRAWVWPGQRVGGPLEGSSAWPKPRRLHRQMGPDG